MTAVDAATRHAVVKLVVGDKTAAVAAAFLTDLKRALRRVGVTMTGVLTDNGPEFTGRAFRDQATAMGVTHHRIPPRSPNHNSVCERFHGTVLREFYRPHFHKGRVDPMGLLDTSLQTWVHDYNNHRPNDSDYMRRRTPRQVRLELNRRLRKTAA